MKICDLHTHVLPGVDDGAQSLPQAVQMLQNAVASDVTHLVMTPHYLPGQETSPMQLQERFLQLRQAARSIPVQLALGAEVRVNEMLLPLLRQGQVPTLNGSRYLLTEFAFHHSHTAFTPVLESILREGYVPLIAHPERYTAVQEHPAMVDSWLDMGCHVQLTGGSIMGRYGTKVAHTAAWLLKHDLVCCVASDAHDPDHRSNFLLDVYDHLSLYYSGQYAKYLMFGNPMRICTNETF